LLYQPAKSYPSLTGSGVGLARTVPSSICSGCRLPAGHAPPFKFHVTALPHFAYRVRSLVTGWEKSYAVVKPESVHQLTKM
jgi:hypothetical protein